MPVSMFPQSRSAGLAGLLGLLVGAVALAPLATATVLFAPKPAFPERPIAVTVEGHAEHYLLYAPPADPKLARPLLIALHGFLGTGANIARMSRLSAEANLHDLVVAYPSGAWWSWGTAPHDGRWASDLALLKAVMRDVSTRVRIDPARIYLAGFSAGGFMAQSVACRGALPVAGVAVVASNLFDSAARACPNPAPVPFLVIHGTEDPVVPYQGSESWAGHIMSVRETLDFWANANGCRGPLVEAAAASADPDVEVRHEFATGCPKGHATEALVLEGAGHDWPGGEFGFPAFVVGRASAALDASAAMLDFLLRYSRGDLARAR